MNLDAIKKRGRDARARVNGPARGTSKPKQIGKKDNGEVSEEVKKVIEDKKEAKSKRDEILNPEPKKESKPKKKSKE